LKADEPQVGQRHENEEMKWEYYHIIIFPEWQITPKYKNAGNRTLHFTVRVARHADQS
jgi:hypothetical protein